MTAKKRMRGVRVALAAAGTAGVLIYALDLYQSVLVLAGGVLALFLAATDLGRQCPLITSFRYLIFRWRSGHVQRMQFQEIEAGHEAPEKSDALQEPVSR